MSEVQGDYPCRPDAVGIITAKPVILCTNTGHSAPVLLRLLGHFCLDRLGRVWLRAPVSRGKTAAMRKRGNALAALPLLLEMI